MDGFVGCQLQLALRPLGQRQRSSVGGEKSANLPTALTHCLNYAFRSLPVGKRRWRLPTAKFVKSNQSLMYPHIQLADSWQMAA